MVESGAFTDDATGPAVTAAVAGLAEEITFEVTMGVLEDVEMATSADGTSESHLLAPADTMGEV